MAGSFKLQLVRMSARTDSRGGLLKGDMYWFFPGKMLPCINTIHWAL